MAEPITFTDKAGRTIVLRELDPSDVMDLLEAAGASSTNEGYMRYAMVIASVDKIDGTPMRSPRNKDQMRANAKLLGNDGFAAATSALFGAAAEAGTAEVEETAKN